MTDMYQYSHLTQRINKSRESINSKTVLINIIYTTGNGEDDTILTWQLKMQELSRPKGGPYPGFLTDKIQNLACMNSGSISDNLLHGWWWSLVVHRISKNLLTYQSKVPKWWVDILS